MGVHVGGNGLRLHGLVPRRGQNLRGEAAQFAAQEGALLRAGLGAIELLLRPRQLGGEPLRLGKRPRVGLGGAASRGGAPAFQRHAQAVDIGALIVNGAARDLERFGLRGHGVAQLGIDGLEFGQGLLGRLQAAVEIRQAPLDGLLEDAVRVLRFLKLAFDAAEIIVQSLDLDAALIGFDQLARGLLLGLVERDLDLAKLDGVLGTELIFVGLDVGERHGHRRLEPARGELHGAVPQRRGKHEGEQASQEEAQRPEHEPLDHRDHPKLAPMRVTLSDAPRASPANPALSAPTQRHLGQASLAPN